MRAAPLDPADRRESWASVRLRHGVLGLLATVALVGAAWQVWGSDKVPVNLLQIELSDQGPPIVMAERGDVTNGIRAEVNGLSAVRRQLSSSLKPLHALRTKGSAGPPGTKKLGLVSVKGPVLAATAPPSRAGDRGRGIETAVLAGPPAGKPSLLMHMLAAKKDAKKSGKKDTKKSAKKDAKKAAKKDDGKKAAKKDDKKDAKKGEKLAECSCCSKPGPCGCCGGKTEDSSIHNTGFFLNGNTVDTASNVIIYGNGAKVTHSGGGVANSGAVGPGGGDGGGYAEAHHATGMRAEVYLAIRMAATVATQGADTAQAQERVAKAKGLQRLPNRGTRSWTKRPARRHAKS